jgi:adenylate cyclase
MISLLLMRLHPWYAVGAALLAVILLTAAGVYAHLHHQFWFAWAVPVAAQTPVALVWGVSFQYFVESRRRQRLRRAFAAYLSPYMANLIANSDVDLALGGKEVQATILFTDLEGFTSFSEGLSPAEVSRLLISYFNETTRAILAQDGTVLKYIGDAVMAVWGAPLPQSDAAERAVLAALGIQEAIRQPIAGRHWRTRIGINSGLVLAGNLGSDFRFDYTLIGDAANVAARLESLNKTLGTGLLISESTALGLSKKFKVRNLGRFVVAGKSAPVSVCEVLAVADEASSLPLWAGTFAVAVDRWTSGDLASAEPLFREVIRMREGGDGPSEFYLKEIERAASDSARLAAWDGIVRVGKKD